MLCLTGLKFLHQTVLVSQAQALPRYITLRRAQSPVYSYIEL